MLVWLVEIGFLAPLLEFLSCALSCQSCKRCLLFVTTCCVSLLTLSRTRQPATLLEVLPDATSLLAMQPCPTYLLRSFDSGTLMRLLAARPGCGSFGPSVW